MAFPSQLLALQTRTKELADFVQDLLVFVRPRARRSEAVVRADSEQLQIVFHNILTNAAQAIGGTGEVDVDIQRTSAGSSVAFADHGPGMPPEIRARAFEAFFTTKHRGTGLGLPTARRIVEAHGGEIVIDPHAADGTVVSVLLPAPL